MSHEKLQIEVKQMIETPVCEDLSDEKSCQYHSCAGHQLLLKRGCHFCHWIFIVSTKVLWSYPVKCFKRCNQITKQNCLLLIGKKCIIAIVLKQKHNTEYYADWLFQLIRKQRFPKRAKL